MITKEWSFILFCVNSSYIFVSSLRIWYNMIWLYSQSFLHLILNWLPLSLIIQFYALLPFLFFNLLRLNCVAHISLDVWSSPGEWLTPLGEVLKKTVTPSPRSCQLPRASQLGMRLSSSCWILVWLELVEVCVYWWVLEVHKCSCSVSLETPITSGS